MYHFIRKLIVVFAAKTQQPVFFCLVYVHMCVHDALSGTGVSFNVYSCLVPNAPRIGDSDEDKAEDR